MKRIVCILSLLCVITVSLASCSFSLGESDPACDRINEMLKSTPYSSITLTTTVTSDFGLETTSEYILFPEEGGVNIQYKVEYLSTFSTDGVLTSPDSYKTVKSGTAMYLDGELISQTGDPVDLGEGIGFPGFNFKKSDFLAIAEEGDSYVGFASDTSSIRDYTLDVANDSNLTVTVAHSGELVTSVSFEYKATNGCSVIQTYTYN